MVAAACSALQVTAMLFQPPTPVRRHTTILCLPLFPTCAQARLKYLLGALVIAHVACFVVSFMLINSSLSYISQIDYAGGWVACWACGRCSGHRGARSCEN